MDIQDTPVDIHNIQGSIWPRLPKYYESYIFFHITNTAQFKKHLAALTDKITTGAQCKEHLIMTKELDEAKNRKQDPEEHRLPFGAINVSLSHKGVQKLIGTDEDKNLKGGLYHKGMYNDLVFEGADNPQRLLPEFKPPADKPKDETWRIDGLFIVAAESEKTLSDKIADLETVMHVRDANVTGINIVATKNGQHRPGEHRGKEHFGFEDHISQPQIRGLDPEPEKGEPSFVEPGDIFLGHEGDPLEQPGWTKEGSFLVFRQLDQKVPEFKKWVDREAKHIKAYQGKDGGEKLAAHMMGRWKSGAPVQLTPNEDKPELAFSNKFDYNPKQGIKHCPFAAHTRKMRPRCDLKDNEDDEDDRTVILRRGITYGPEVGPDETEETKKERGIFFLCYQSDIRNGFNFIMTRWVSNHFFPEGKTATSGQGAGVDPFVNQRIRDDHPEGHISLFDGENEKTHRLGLGGSPWVDQRGGEYFFTPSIKALKGYLVQ